MSNKIQNDIDELSKTDLKSKYILSYQSWSNMKQRGKNGCKIHPDFEDFSNFLSHVGARTSKDFTLDRLNNDDPEYAPGKVQWRDKKAQNNNRSNNIFLTHEDGRKMTITQWAEELGEKSNTLFKRHSSGWSDMEIISGQRNFTDEILIESNPWPFREDDYWEDKWQKAVLSGFMGIQLEFLNISLSSTISNIENEIVFIECILGSDKYEQNKREVLIAHIDEERRKHRLKLLDMDKDSLGVLKCKLEDKVSVHKKTLGEVKEQCRWVGMRNGLKNIKTKHVGKPMINSYFETHQPRPSYFVNQADEKTEPIKILKPTRRHRKSFARHNNLLHIRQVLERTE